MTNKKKGFHHHPPSFTKIHQITNMASGNPIFTSMILPASILPRLMTEGSTPFLEIVPKGSLWLDPTWSLLTTWSGSAGNTNGWQKNSVGTSPTEWFNQETSGLNLSQSFFAGCMGIFASRCYRWMAARHCSTPSNRQEKDTSDDHTVYLPTRSAQNRSQSTALRSFWWNVNPLNQLWRLHVIFQHPWARGIWKRYKHLVKLDCLCNNWLFVKPSIYSSASKPWCPRYAKIGWFMDGYSPSHMIIS